jgi:hypothetical protein
MSMQWGDSRKQTHCSGPIPTINLGERGRVIQTAPRLQRVIVRKRSRRLSIPVEA